MGQYYKAVNIDKQVNAGDLPGCRRGAKLMEHSWAKNDWVNAVGAKLLDEWAGDRMVWAGDYADETILVKGHVPGAKITKKSDGMLWLDIHPNRERYDAQYKTYVIKYTGDLPLGAVRLAGTLNVPYEPLKNCFLVEVRAEPVELVGVDRAKIVGYLTDEYHAYCGNIVATRPVATPPKYYKNLDRDEYIDIRTTPEDDDGWQVHALPLLLADGNNRGGGDYREGNPDFNLVGRWAKQRIQAFRRRPLGTQIFPNFSE